MLLPVPTPDALDRLLREEERLVLLAFLDPGCEPCRELRPRLERLAAEQASLCAVVLVDAAENKEAVTRFGVTAFPTLLFLKRGVELRRFKGGALPPSVLALLNGSASTSEPGTD
jgi:thioredoxin reductase (NADPH)